MDRKEVIVCPCGKEFIEYRYRQRQYCSRRCMSVYAARQIQATTPTCHPERPHKGRGLCAQCFKYDSSLRRNYNITIEQWNAMFIAQEGRCPICVRELVRHGSADGRRAANVDHDHVTGAVRGLTCHVCNRNRIGTNNIDTARRLVAYLERGYDGRSIVPTDRHISRKEFAKQRCNHWNEQGHKTVLLEPNDHNVDLVTVSANGVVTMVQCKPVATKVGAKRLIASFKQNPPFGYTPLGQFHQRLEVKVLNQGVESIVVA